MGTIQFKHNLYFTFRFKICSRKIMDHFSPQNVHILIPEPVNVTLHRNWDFADLIMLRNLN